MRVLRRSSWLRVHSAPAEDLSSFPSINVRQLQPPVNCSSRKAVPSSGFSWPCTHTPPFTCTHFKNKIRYYAIFWDSNNRQGDSNLKWSIWCAPPYCGLNLGSARRTGNSKYWNPIAPSAQWSLAGVTTLRGGHFLKEWLHTLWTVAFVSPLPRHLVRPCIPTFIFWTSVFTSECRVPGLRDHTQFVQCWWLKPRLRALGMCCTLSRRHPWP